MASGRESLEIRRSTDADLGAAVELAAKALGWVPGKPNAELFGWKHLDNPFGQSPMWLAVRDGQLVGFRAFLRWRFIRPDGSVARAVRAVDTATHPDFQGQGIFTALTNAAVEEMRSEEIDFVFNTPNDLSRPGYLKMGWSTVGHIPVRVRLRSPGAAWRVARARVPAEKWSLPSKAGESAEAVLRDRDAVASLLSECDLATLYRTDRSVDYLAWRYRFAALGYRAICVGGDARRGTCIFRVRRRGAATEATVCELLVPGGQARLGQRLLSEVTRVTRADYLIWSGPRLPPSAGFIPLPRQGPILTWRPLTQLVQPPLADWALTLGDIELF